MLHATIAAKVVLKSNSLDLMVKNIVPSKHATAKNFTLGMFTNKFVQYYFFFSKILISKIKLNEDCSVVVKYALQLY